jgi:hypothetical protein
MTKKKYKIVLYEGQFGVWSFEVWTGEERIHAQKSGYNKEHTRAEAVRFTTGQKDYGSHELTVSHFSPSN